MARTYNILTVALLILTALLVLWAAIVLANPGSSVNPLPPRTESAIADSATPTVTSAPVTQLAIVTLAPPTPTSTLTPTTTDTPTATATPIPSMTPTPMPTTPAGSPTPVPTAQTPSSPAPAGEALPSSTSPPPPPPTVGPASSSGAFELGGQVAGFDDPEKMKYAGMTWVKRQLRWSPDANPNDAAGLIDDAHAKGFKILLSALGDPESIRGGAPSAFADFASYVGAVAALGADAIEVWNEMNIDREWPLGEIDPVSYTEMLRQAYTAIKAANPNTLVISGAPAPTGFFGGCSGAGCDDKPYIEGMVSAGALNYLDCIGIHYNEGIVPPTQSSGDPRGNPTHYTRYYQTMVDTYYNAARGRRKLCFTELGYLSGEEWGTLPAGFLWKPPFNLTVAEHAQYLADAARLSRDQGKVRLMIVFNVDLKTFDSDPQAGYAIIRPDGTCPACETLRAVMVR